MTVESNYVIAIATFSDWLKRLAPVFQPMISKTKTNRTMYLGGSYEQVHSTGVEKDDFFTCHRRVPLISLTFPKKYDLPRGRFLENRLSPCPDNEFMLG